MFWSRSPSLFFLTVVCPSQAFGVHLIVRSLASFPSLTYLGHRETVVPWASLGLLRPRVPNFQRLVVTTEHPQCLLVTASVVGPYLLDLPFTRAVVSLS